MDFSFKKFLSTISKKPEDNLQPSASSAVPQPPAQPFWERNNPRSSVETAFEVIPSEEVISENIVNSQWQSSVAVGGPVKSDIDAVPKQAQMDDAVGSSRGNSVDKEPSASVSDAESTVPSDSSVFDNGPVYGSACLLNTSSKTTPPKMLDFDIDSLINKVKQSMLNPQGDAKKKDTADGVSVSGAVVSEVADNALPAASDKKVWRQGMSDGDKNSTKTVFIRKSLNPTYDNCAKETTTYESASKKLTREIEYFAKILDKVQADMAGNEYRTDEGVVKGVRESLKQRMSELIVKMNLFSNNALEGDIGKSSVVTGVSEKVSDASVEYVFPSERKTNNSESDKGGPVGSRVNKCADCNGHFVVNCTETVESVMLTHAQSQFHRSVVGNPVSESNTTVEKIITLERVPSAVEKMKKIKKDVVSAKLLMINRMTACLIDDSLLNCAVCGVACDAKDPKPHMELAEHGDLLVAYNLKEQRQLMRNNPDAFASFKLTDLHYVLNKIFVDPIGKFAYCGVCRKEVPAHQKNIEGHVDSPNHNKLLVAALNVAPSNEKEHDDVLGDFLAKSSVQQQQPQPSNRMDSVGVPEESSLLRYVRKNHGFRHMNGTYACLICNVKRMSTVKKINGHFSGKQHSEISNKMAACSAVTPDQKAELLDNFVSATYDVQPIMYECLICGDFETSSRLEVALHHIVSDRHIRLKEQYLRQPASVLQPPHLKYAKIVPFKDDSSKMFCMLCRVPLDSIIAAFEHVKTRPHNPDTLIEYIHNAGNGIYNCMACSISFRGNAALISHTSSNNHVVAKFTKEMTKVNQEKNAAPVSAATPKGFMIVEQDGTVLKNPSPVSAATTKGFMIVEQDGTILKNPSKKNNVKSKTADSTVRSREKNSKERDLKAAVPVNNKNVQQKVLAEEMALLNSNGVVHLGNETYFCRPCSNGKMSREEVFGHIFSVQHAESIHL